LDTAKYVHEFLGELEGCLLEFKTFPWRVGKEEPKIDMDYMAFSINEDVSIVPVLYLENIADQTIGSKRLAEGLRRFFVPLCL